MVTAYYFIGHDEPATGGGSGLSPGPRTEWTAKIGGLGTLVSTCAAFGFGEEVGVLYVLKAAVLFGTLGFVYGSYKASKQPTGNKRKKREVKVRISRDGLLIP